MSRLVLEIGDIVDWDAFGEDVMTAPIIDMRHTSEGPQYRIKLPKRPDLERWWIPRCQLQWRSKGENDTGTVPR